MKWNYRVMEFEEEGEKYRAIHEVYYMDDSDQPYAYSEAPVPLMWYEGEDAESILNRMRDALDKPVLTEDDFPTLRALRSTA